MDFHFDHPDGTSISRPLIGQISSEGYQPQALPQQSLQRHDKSIVNVGHAPLKNTPGLVDTSLSSSRSPSSSGDSPATKLNDFDPIDELTDLTYVLDPVGQILYASSAVHALFEYTLEDVVGHNIMEFIHNDDVRAFVTAFNDAIMTNTTLFHYHRFRRRAGEFVILETNGRAVYSDTDLTMDENGRAVPACRCCILSARVYPTPSMTALDSFLELKLDNERLKAELREFGETDPIVIQPAVPKSTNAKLMAKMATQQRGGDTPGSKADGSAKVKPKSAMQTLMSAAHQGVVQTDYGFPRTNTGGLVPAPYDSPQVMELHTPTGMKPRESIGSVRDSNRGFKDLSKPSTGQLSHKTVLPKPSGVRSDQTLSEEAQLRKKNKKTKVELERHICSDCQTTDSPEWRKGPQGPKTLCNACGLRYSKKQKKTEQFLQLHNNGVRSEASTHSSESGRERSIKSRSVSESQTPTDVMARHAQSYAWGPETQGLQAVLKGAPDETFAIGLPYWP
ncbi:protein of unknown function [Taphrina deformans PYCC 5710]|uniref:Uncharacterized protein n=1 Tax=Taphrina deformans (strain PYCC 5710 / ATCC 11124 / CBS 356.35 / IMI 108563 / JCM 9778 / NBRC 8474) TaxID=1097556 RepID=R4XGV4_TAPDE|nr:protein of unknown function [Taphrina deformans PYCC 5710]|eukprot:CCG83728.1 protein of unknown function [Taphrina deformans PYCC 5710]